MSANKKGVPPLSGSFESRAFFSALISAVKGEDKKAGDILRKIAENMTTEFDEEVKKSE